MKCVDKYIDYIPVLIKGSFIKHIYLLGVIFYGMLIAGLKVEPPK